jgi:dihydropteroate synthase
MTAAAVQPVEEAPAFAGVSLERPRIMGILNITPDSFSDGGEAFAVDAAARRADSMAEAGAAFLDVGGESTRPGAEPVAPKDEIARVVPVIRAIRGLGLPVSIDTRNAQTMRAALDAGAAIVNDVTALTWDAEALRVVEDARCPVVLMHMKGTPQTMQKSPRYDDVVAEVRAFLLDRARACTDAGVAADQVALDPGIGFGKTVDHNMALIAHLDVLAATGHPVLLGVSRKSFIGKLSRGEAAQARVPGSLAAALAGVAKGARILRVHDVAETAQALAVWRAVGDAGRA